MSYSQRNKLYALSFGIACYPNDVPERFNAINEAIVQSGKQGLLLARQRKTLGVARPGLSCGSHGCIGLGTKPGLWLVTRWASLGYSLSKPEEARHKICNTTIGVLNTSRIWVASLQFFCMPCRCATWQAYRSPRALRAKADWAWAEVSCVVLLQLLPRVLLDIDHHLPAFRCRSRRQAMHRDGVTRSTFRRRPDQYMRERRRPNLCSNFSAFSSLVSPPDVK